MQRGRGKGRSKGRRKGAAAAPKEPKFKYVPLADSDLDESTRALYLGSHDLPTLGSAFDHLTLDSEPWQWHLPFDAGEEIMEKRVENSKSSTSRGHELRKGFRRQTLRCKESRARR